MNLKDILNQLAAARSPNYLANDPLSFCHRYPDPTDREIVALIAASFAYGKVTIILGNLEKIFAATGTEPRKYVENFEPGHGLKQFARFKHRFNDGRDLCALLLAIRNMLIEAGSIEQFFLQGFNATDTDTGPGLTSFSSRILAMDFSWVFGTDKIPEDAYFPFLFPSPAGGSACKRLCMFLRWMVRPEDGIDLGLWQGIRPDQLVIPVDAHIQRISRHLGLTTRRQADWKTALEITSALARLDPADPVKYDFSLCHLGISEGCGKSGKNACLTCDIAGLCSGIIKI